MQGPKKIIPKFISNLNQIIQLTLKNGDVISKKKIDNLPAFLNGGIDGGDEGGVHSLEGRPCSEEDAID